MSAFTKHVKKYAKGYIAFATAVATAVKLVIDDGITAQEWITVIIATLGAAAVFAVPNADDENEEDEGSNVDTRSGSDTGAAHSPEGPE